MRTIRKMKLQLAAVDHLMKMPAPTSPRKLKST
jgi:hypothetical protein